EIFAFQAKTQNLKDKNIVWTVSNQKYATIDRKTGKLRAKRAGTVIVTAKCETKKVTCKLTIKR
ncbi:MAG: Ig-like domain-containing protein, partial [Lachnospiraceae bacterium]